MVSEVLFSATRQDWRTPEKVRLGLVSEFGVLYDVSDRHGGFFDSFRDEWPSRCFANPPYGPEIGDWLREAVHQAPDLVVFLLPARTDTKWFHEIVLPNASEIRFIKGRLKFSGHENSAPFPSMLVIFRNER